MTTETSNARGEVVAWFPTNAQGEIIRNYGDGSPVYACRTKEEAEQAKRCHLGATGPVIPLYAAPPPSVPEGWVLVPREPTDEMVEAAWDSDAADYVGEHKRIHSLWLAWAAMLAAAPEPKPEPKPREVFVDFPQVGIAGPFPVEGGKVTLPDVTMNDLIQHARTGYVKQQPEARGVVDEAMVERAIDAADAAEIPVWKEYRDVKRAKMHAALTAALTEARNVR